jgi:hypothetical protein
MTIVINYQRPTSRDFTGENVGVRLTRADKQAIVALRDLLRPTVPMANYSDIIRVALQTAAEALAEKAALAVAHSGIAG